MEIRDYIIIFSGYVIPLVAIIISIFSFHESKKVNKVQLRVNEIEEKLKKYELEEKEKEREEAIKSTVEARIYNVSKGKYRLKIWNSGQATAYDVNFKVPDEINGLVFRDKVPYEVLEPGKSFEEHIVVYNEMLRKFIISTIWKNANGEYFEKKQLVSF